jgi:hypothetical protein
MRPIRMLVADACTSPALTLPGVAGAAPAAALAHGLAAAPGQFPFAVKLVMTGIPSPSGDHTHNPRTGGRTA